MYLILLFFSFQKPEAVEVSSGGGAALLGPDGEVNFNPWPYYSILK